MKTPSLWIIRIALTIQFLGVLAVPALIGSSEAPRGMWMAEWIRPQKAERTIGVLTLREGKLKFVEQVGNVDWEIELTSVKRVSLKGANALLIVSTAGDEYVVAIMNPDLTPGAAKKSLATIDRALQTLAANNR